jgi:hypothetical protein
MDFKNIISTIDGLAKDDDNIVFLHDSFDLELNEHFVIETGVVGFTEDGIILEADDETIEFLELNDMLAENNLAEDELNEAEYQGRKVTLNKPMQGDVKKSKVYVKNAKGNVVKVNFGHGGSSAKGKTMSIKKNNPERRKSFRARHNCKNPGPKWKARYWSCRAW